MIIQSNVPLKDKNWFNVGGNALFFAAPTTIEETTILINYAQANNIPITFLGGGANILISDDGIDGLVIKSGIKTITIASHSINENEVLVTAGSGVTIEELIYFCFDHNCIGLEEFSGIPSSVGGALYINLHYFSFLISAFVSSAEIFDSHERKIIHVDKTWFEFGYDTSKLSDKRYFLISATFALKKASHDEIQYAKGRSHEIIRHRRQRYPYKGTCGSFFRNFHPHEVTLESNGKKMIYAAYYLDKIGVKGTLQKDDAIVSHQHANMIVNQGNATAKNIIDIAKIMQEKVFQEFGITLQPECELLGFIEYPLLFKK